MADGSGAPSRTGSADSDKPDTDLVSMPSFISKRNDGLWVDISALDSPELLMNFVEHVFDSNACFTGLDYALFLKLLFEYTPADIDALLKTFEQGGKSPVVRLADDIAAFPASRQALYRGVKLSSDGASCDYFFEQISIERRLDPPNENSISQLLGMTPEVASERAYLDFDEFVAALWLKGVRYGIDSQRVRDAIAADKVERLTVAVQKLPDQGCNASIAEQTSNLHRSDRPTMRQDGRMDLCLFANRFPQVKAQTRLFKKVPRQQGVSGWTVKGKELPPEAVKDFDISTLAGPGSRVVYIPGDGEYVVASIDGFLNIDTRSGQISVTEKIINREGVSTRTTGNLVLTGEFYEEHGDVQEKRLVKGCNMSFLANVYGTLISSGGAILIKQNLAGGSVRNLKGTIQVEGKTSRAQIEANDGQIDLADAESSRIIGRTVRIQHAKLCDIVADEVIIERAEGCAIAARNIRITQSAAWRDINSVACLLLPDTAGHDQLIDTLTKEIEKLETQLNLQQEQFKTLINEPDMKSYLALQPKIKAKTMVLNKIQQLSWEKLLDRVAPALRFFTHLRNEIKLTGQALDDCRQRCSTVKSERAAAIAATGCEIAEVTGETIVRTRAFKADAPALSSLAHRELKIQLREAGAAEERIFSGTQGSFSWSHPECADLSQESGR